jgi:hypothetical protein
MSNRHIPNYGEFMTSFDVQMLLMQGYRKEDVFNNLQINILARWTPLACGICGSLGFLLKSPIYLWLLGLLTLAGAVSNRSIYDYFYQVLIRPFISLGDMPHHGAPRRFGCAIGAILYLLSGTGFQLQRPLLSFIPILIIVPLAFIAAFTQWCFASALYRFLSGKNVECC